MSEASFPSPEIKLTPCPHSDLTLGAIYYRKLVNIASGWVHHTVYIGLFLYVLHRRWTYIAATGAIFELPTFVMGIACMFPRLRSNIGFTSTFFLTRIFFHFALILTMASPKGRQAAFVDGSWAPFFCITLPFPMHLWWGYKAIRGMQRRAAKRRLQKQTRLESDNSFAVSAGQFFNGVAPPDVSSALNTPATTPGSGARAETNFGSTHPVNSAFAKAVAAAGATTRPMRLFIGKRDKSGSRADSASSSRAASGRATPSALVEVAQNPFTAPIAPEGADPDAKEPFLAIRSPAETSDRARRLIADAVRKAWNNAPETWRKQVESEARMRPPRIPLGNRGNSNYSVLSESSDSLSSSSEDGAGDEQEAMFDAPADILAAAAQETSVEEEKRERGQRAAARRAVIRAVRRAINGRNSDGGPVDGSSGQNGRDSTLSPVDFSALLNRLPPDFFSQNYQVREFPVERDQSESRQKRILAQIRRRMEVARRDVMVFD